MKPDIHCIYESDIFNITQYVCKSEKETVYCNHIHTHEFYETFVLLTGKFNHRINDKIYTLNTGDAVFFAPGETHDFISIPKNPPIVLTMCISKKEFEKYCSCFGDSLKHNFSFERNGIITLSKEEFSLLSSNYEMFKLARNDAKDFIFQTIFTTAIMSLLKNSYRLKVYNDHQSLDYILYKMNTPENLSQGMPALLDISKLSQRHLTRLMREQYNMTPHEYITKMRMNYAKNLLLHTDNDILNIALEVGYSSVNNFINQFKKHYNTTPKKYRNSNTYSNPST